MLLCINHPKPFFTFLSNNVWWLKLFFFHEIKKNFIVRGKMQTTIFLESPIQRALYGHRNNLVHVTESVQRFVWRKKDFVISHLTLNCVDPAVGNIKTLFLYLHNARALHFPENRHVLLLLRQSTSTMMFSDQNMMLYCQTKPSTTISTQYLLQDIPRIIVSDFRRPTLNILMYGWCLTLTGGPYSILCIAQQMIRQGCHVRIWNTVPTEVKGRDIWGILPSYGLSSLRDSMEWMEYEDMQHMECSPQDVFMATLYLTTFLASALQKQVNDKPILYMIQDCEPYFYSHDSNAAYVYSTYEVPHIAIFNSWLLEKHFRNSRLSVFSEDSQEKRFYTFFPEYSSMISPSSWKKDDNTKKRLIVYSRPHIDRNAYEFTMTCIWEAVRQDLFPDSEWLLLGIGGLPGIPNVSNLGNKNVTMYMIEHLNQDEYHEFLKTGDLVFCIMMSPHPSLPPFDFVSAGMVVVTNELFQRTRQDYLDISPNFFPAKTSVQDIVAQFRKALLHVHDLELRLRGSHMNLPPSTINFSEIQHFLES